MVEDCWVAHQLHVPLKLNQFSYQSNHFETNQCGNFNYGEVHSTFPLSGRRRSAFSPALHHLAPAVKTSN